MWQTTTIVIALIVVDVRLIQSHPAVDSGLESKSSYREGKFFPFYTIGRFLNVACTGQNGLQGTCVINGECADTGGLAAGSCSAQSRQAVCCIYTFGCGATSQVVNSYFHNAEYPGPSSGGSRCAIAAKPFDNTICQLRIDFLDFSLAQPTGDGLCTTDYMAVMGGTSRVPRICGENTGQHVYVDFNGQAAINIAFESTGSVAFNRHWNLKLTQIECASTSSAPPGCLQFHMAESGAVQSLNYASSPNSNLNSIGVTGTRQLASNQYGICIRAGPNRCSITYTQTPNDPYSFTMTTDAMGVDPTLIGTSSVASQVCNTDYVIIPSPIRNNVQLTTTTDRFCGLGFIDTTSNVRPFSLVVVHNGNEANDIANRGFRLEYSQGACPV